MRHILHKIALSPYTALSPIGPHCVPMGLNPSVVSFFFCSGRRRRLPPRPLCGSDPMQPEGPLAKVISIHAPRVGSDVPSAVAAVFTLSFQSTLPVWGATVVRSEHSGLATFQSTLPVWGATPLAPRCRAARKFQSTLPVWGATPSTKMAWVSEIFQSTLPVWGATASMHKNILAHL